MYDTVEAKNILKLIGCQSKKKMGIKTIVLTKVLSDLSKEKKMITSVKNEKVKAWKKLHRKKDRVKTGTFLIEGDHLLEEAYQSGWEIKELIAVENVHLPKWTEQFEITFVSGEVMKEVSQTIAPQGLAAVIKIKNNEKPKGDRLLLLDAIQD